MKKLFNNKIMNNIMWLIFDKVFILILQFMVGVKIANYYGSEIYGEYSYIIAILSFSSIFFELLNNRVIKKFYTDDNYENIIYNITFFKNIIAILLFFIALGTKLFINIRLNFYFVLVFLAMDNIFTTMTTGIENFYEYKFDVKKIVISNNIVKIISYSLQYLGILLNYSIVMIPIVRCIGSIIRVLILKYTYNKTYKRKNIDVKLNKQLILKILKNSFYLWGSYIAYLIYTQIDKIMLGSMLGVKDVGVYNIALQLSTILMIIVGPIQTILFSKMIELYNENYNKYIKYYFKANFILTQIYIYGILISIVVVEFMFPYVFSKEYIGAIEVYNVLTISVLMKANGAFQTGHMTLKNITKKSFYKTMSGLVINGILNYFLIKKYGILGAAWATSITQVFTLLIIDFFIKEYREQAWIQLKAFNPLYAFNLIRGSDTIVQK